MEDNIQQPNGFSSLLLVERMSDVTFAVGVPPQSYPCHKLVLALKSNVFEAMFFGKMAEQREVKVPDISQAGFTTMLRYLYTNDIVIKNQVQAIETAYAAQKYLIKPLFQACENYLLRATIMDQHTVFILYEVASFLEMKRLQGRCLGYISRNAKRIFELESFLSASKSTFLKILEMDLMDVDSEMEIMRAIWNWGEENCKSMNLKCSKENIRNLTKDLLKHVRFLSLNSDELRVVLEKFQLLDTSEQLAVLWSLAMPKSTSGTVKLPCNLCTISRARSLDNCSRIHLPVEYRYNGRMGTFSLEEQETEIEITVTGGNLTILGVTVNFKPIPCYSANHRTMNVDLHLNNINSKMHSTTKSSMKADKNQDEQIEKELFFDDYVTVSEGDYVILNLRMDAEGIRTTQCNSDIFTRQCGKVYVTFKFNTNGTLLPLKEIMCTSS